MIGAARIRRGSASTLHPDVDSDDEKETVPPTLESLNKDIKGLKKLLVKTHNYVVKVFDGQKLSEKHEKVILTAEVATQEKLNFLESAAGGKHVTERTRAALRRCNFALAINSDPDLSLVPFQSHSDMIKFFKGQRRIEKLIRAILIYFPWGNFWLTSVIRNIVDESMRKDYFWSGTQT